MASRVLKYCYVVESAVPVDGDTIKVQLDLGWSLFLQKNVRIQGIDTPENSTYAGKLVTQVVENWIKRRPDLLYWSIEKVDKYGRPLGDLFSFDDHQGTLAVFLINSGLAKPMTTSRPEWSEDHLQRVETKCMDLLR